MSGERFSNPPTSTAWSRNELAALEVAESDERYARLNFDLAGYEVERVKLIVRLITAAPVAE